jgi:hypothetical protein
VTFVSSAIRNLIRIVDFLPAFYGIGVIVMFVDRRARRLGDLAGGTLVVKERRGVTLESLTTSAVMSAAQSSGAAQTPTLPNVHLLNDQDYSLVQEFLRRREATRSASFSMSQPSTSCFGGSKPIRKAKNEKRNIVIAICTFYVLRFFGRLCYTDAPI